MLSCQPPEIKFCPILKYQKWNEYWKAQLKSHIEIIAILTQKSFYRFISTLQHVLPEHFCYILRAKVLSLPNKDFL